MIRAFVLLLALTSPATADPGRALAAAAQAQVGVTVIREPAYVGLEFPGSNFPHIGIIAEGTAPGGTPLVTHNIDAAARTWLATR